MSPIATPTFTGGHTLTLLSALTSPMAIRPPALLPSSTRLTLMSSTLPPRPCPCPCPPLSPAKASGLTASRVAADAAATIPAFFSTVILLSGDPGSSE